MRIHWTGVAAAYVAAVVGAGFATGQELAHFFARHGRWGLAAAAAAGVLFAVAGAAILRRSSVARHQHYGALLRDLCGPRLGRVMDTVSFCSLFIALSTTLAAGGALAHILLGYPRWLGACAMSAALSAAARRGLKAHVGASALTVPAIVLVCLRAAATSARRPPPFDPHVVPLLASLASAVLYVSYNLIMGMASLCATSGAQPPREATRAGWVGGALLGLLCVAGCAALLSQALPGGVDLPLRMALPPGPWRTVVYPLTLLAALWTTGSAAALALGQRLCPAGPESPASVVVVLALPPALAGLAPLIAVAYPVVGYAGVPLLLALGWAACHGQGHVPRAR